MKHIYFSQINPYNICGFSLLKNKANFLFILLFTFLGINTVLGQTTTVYTTAGAKLWICPNGVTSVQVEA